MSEQPLGFGFGQQHYGQMSSQPNPYQSSANAQYPPYGVRSTPGTSFGEDYATSLSAFEYNSNRLPGFGGVAPAPPQPPPQLAIANSYNTSAILGSWAQHPPFAPSSAAIDQAALLNTTSSFTPNHTIPSYTQAERAPRASAQAKTQAVLPPTTSLSFNSKPQAGGDMEEGELSEGQFEDLYDESSQPDVAADTADPPANKTIIEEIGEAVEDVGEEDFYDNEEEAKTSEKSDSNRAREQTASYSPVSPPRETLGDVEMSNNSQVASKPQPLAPKQTASDSFNVVPGLGRLPQKKSTMATDTSVSATVKGLSQRRSLTEAKKEAQKAVLRLWPLGVRYQNYLEEGFNESFMKSIFNDLHLDMTASQSNKHASQPSVLAGRNPESSPAAKMAPPSQAPDGQQQQPKPAPEVKESSTMSDAAGKSEERKDRIARLLAAKKANKATVPSTPAEAPKPQESKPLTTAKSANARVDKSLLLQERMKALEERRAQAQRSAAAGPSGSSTPSAPLATQVSSHAPNGTRGNVAPSRTEGTVGNGVQSSVPALINASARAGPPKGPRKRPVAADFVEYSSTGGQPKRPFGQERKDPSLVIDVSDDSDGEMDMDIDSQPDMSVRRGDATRRGPSVREFPPLTDTTNRKFASPASSSASPSVATNGNRNPELEEKEKLIQEMKRKIAEKEARKALQKGTLQDRSKSADLARTPDRASPQRMGTKLPKLSEIRRVGKQEMAVRRDRIVSLELPRVNSELDAKTLRLRQLQDEVARLEAELGQHLEEKTRLGEELKEIDTTAPEDVATEQGGVPGPKPVSRSGSTASIDMQTTFSSNGTSSVPESAGSEPGEIAGTPHYQEGVESEQITAQIASEHQAAQQKLQETEQSQPENAELPHRDRPAERDTTSPATSEKTPASGAPNRDDSSMPDNVVGPALLQEGLANDEASKDNEDQDVAMDEDSDESDDDDSKPNVIEAEPPLAPLPATAPTSVPENLEGSQADKHTPEEALSLDQPARTPDHVSAVAPAQGETSQTENQAPGEGLTNSAPAGVDLTFKPYESPLQYFHAYRFHPRYLDNISGGLKSLTYSNKICAKDQVCPYELSGEPCPSNCTFQHFKTMNIPDDKILLELGKADEFTGEQKNRFIQGLKQVLRHFRDQKIKDFDAIARGIIDFRARFLGDKSRVLPLEGVTI